MSDLELQSSLGFNEEDLIANRDCRLSARQQEKVNKSEQFNKRLLVGTGIILILITVGNAYGVISDAIKPGFSFSAASQDDLIGVVTAIGISGLLLGFFAWSSFKMAGRKADHSVQQVRGKVNFIKAQKVFSEKMPNGSMYYRTVEAYDLRVANVNFDNVNQNLIKTLEEGDIYAFYYTKDAKDILSIERITKGK